MDELTRERYPFDVPYREQNRPQLPRRRAVPLADLAVIEERRRVLLASFRTKNRPEP